MNDVLPNEIFEKIFTYLNPKSLMACRVVCRIWQTNADVVMRKESFWQSHCRKYYNDIYQSAHVKALPDLRWFHLYKSLSLWPRIQQTTENMKEFAVGENIEEQNVNLRIIGDGVVGVLKKKSLVYYKLDTLDQLHELTINGNDFYSDYKETDDLIVLYKQNQDLVVRRKEARDVIVAIFRNVRMFIILENVIYYVSFENMMLYRCRYAYETYVRTPLVETTSLVLSLGHENGVLYILTDKFKVYKLVNDELNYVFESRNYIEEFEILSRYNFANNTDWTNCVTRLTYLHTATVVEYPRINKLRSIRIYGPLVFAVYEFCIVRIFYSLYKTSLLNLLKTSPIKQLNLMAVFEYKLNLTILNVDVIEGENCHTIIVGKENKIHAIKFSHNFSEEPSTSTHPVIEQPSTSTHPVIEQPSTSRGLHESSSEEPLPKIAKRSDK